MKKIEVTISPTGESRIEAHGYRGSSCLAATRQLEAALGVHGSESVKPEFYQNETTNNQQHEEQ